MLDKMGVIAELETHMDFMREGTLGRLLANAHRLIKSQGKELVELRDANKALTGHETLLLERLKKAEKPKRTRTKKS
jgi:hypothetical protein